MYMRQKIRESLKRCVGEETFENIEDYLQPQFDSNTVTLVVDKDRKTRNIVCDGHGVWREIKPQRNTAGVKPQGYTGDWKIDYKQAVTSRSPSINSPQTQTLNSTQNNTSNPLRTFSRHDYSALSTTMRSNLFPGVGNYDWKSQSGALHSQTALKLGRHTRRELGNEFYGLTRDALGAWNEASVQHERMKKSWDNYLASKGSLQQSSDK